MFIRVRDTHSRSITKAISWRILGSLDTFLISWLITGNVKAAGSIAGIETLSKIVLYYLHERAWSKVPLGARRAVEGAPPLVPDHAAARAAPVVLIAQPAAVAPNSPVALSQGA